MSAPARLARQLLLLTLVLALSLSCCSALLASPRLRQLRLLRLEQQRQRLLDAPTLLSDSAHPQSLSSAVSQLTQLDCPLTSNWTTNFSTSIGVFGLAPIGSCTLLVLHSNRTWHSFITSLDVRDGTVHWSLYMAEPTSIFSDDLAIAQTENDPPTRVYVGFRNFTTRDCDFSCDSIRAVEWEGGQPRVLWTVVLGDDDHFLQSVKTARGTGSEDVLGVFSEDSEEWVSIAGSSGRVLSRGPQTSSAGLALLGDGSSGPAQLLKTEGGNATVYELQKNGTWQQRASRAKWDASQYHLLGDDSSSLFSFGLPQRPASVLALQSATQADRWQGLDLASGAQLWQASGYDIFTGAWVTQAQDGFRAQPAQVALHPLNTSRAIVSARAFNSSYALICQFAVMDLTTGRLLATSPITAYISTTGSYNVYVSWHAASSAIATILDLPGSTIPSLYLAYDADAMQPVSAGLLPTGNPLHEVLTQFGALTKEGAALLWRTKAGQVVAQTAKAWKGEGVGEVRGEERVGKVDRCVRRVVKGRSQ